MNFFSHAVIADSIAPSAPFIVGAMLPDLASMASLEPIPPKTGALIDGVTLHHETDAVFHALEPVRGWMRDGARHLREDGVPRHAARAAAHVGIELALDGALATPERVGAWRAAVEAAGDDGSGVGLAFSDEESAERFANLRRRLLAGDLPEGYAEPRIVADRVARVLARRPRLALRDEAASSLAAAAHEWVRIAAAEAEATLELVLTGVRRRAAS